MRFNFSLLFLLALSISSCSTFNRMAISTSSNLMYSASGDMETETNYEATKLALIPNLKLLEGLLSQAPSNNELLFTLTKGYTGMAFMINETEMLEEEWGNHKTEENKKQALRNYTKGFNYGLRYLENSGISKDNLFQDTEKSLAKNLSNKQMDLEAVLFTAQALGGMINLQKDNMTLVSQLPIVKTMFDWACSKKPDLNYGACDIFMGAYEAGRPKMLGGNPEKGRDYFVNAISKYPHNWLIRTSFIQFYLIPMSDEEGFNREMIELQKFFQEFESANIYSPNSASVKWNTETHLSIYQSLAMKRYELLQKYRKQLF